MITYDKLFVLLKDRGYTTYRIRKERIISNHTYQAIRTGAGGLDHRTINNICRALKCQPGDIMEYVDDEEKAVD